MKYLKTYEESKNKNFWLVRTDEPYLLASLYKLGANDKQIDLIRKNVIIKNNSKAYIGINNFGRIDWNPYRGTYSDYNYTSFKNTGYKYQGELELTSEDIKNWELKENTKKFNL